MMSFQKFTTLAALVLYASNAALAAPVPQLPVPALSSVTQPLNILSDVVGTAGSLVGTNGGLVGTAENLVGGPVSSVTPVLSNVPVAGNVVRDDGLPPLDSFVPPGLPTVKTVVDAVTGDMVPPAAKGVVRRDSLTAVPASLPVSLPTLPVVGDLNNVGAMNLPVVGSILPSVVPNVGNII